MSLYNILDGNNGKYASSTIVAQILARAKWVSCDCGCERDKPADAASVAYVRAANIVSIWQATATVDNAAMLDRLGLLSARMRRSFVPISSTVDSWAGEVESIMRELHRLAPSAQVSNGDMIQADRPAGATGE